MNQLIHHRMSPEDLSLLRRSLSRLPSRIPFQAEPRLASLVASLGICREAGTLNDEMARFVFDASSGAPVPRESIRAELVRYGEAFGVRIWAEGYSRLELRFRGIRPLLHPRFSFNEDGSVRQCVLFPETISRIAAEEGVELVLVKEWGLNTIFGGFDPSKHYYATNLWELENNDTLRFAQILEQSQLPLLGTHDLVAHVAGIKASEIGPLQAKAAQVRSELEEYFNEVATPSIAALILPYTAGVLLDDLAQPPNYSAPNRVVVIDEILSAIRNRAVSAKESRVLMRFPGAYEEAIRLARNEDLREVKNRARGVVDRLVDEINRHSVFLEASGALPEGVTAQQSL